VPLLRTYKAYGPFHLFPKPSSKRVFFACQTDVAQNVWFFSFSFVIVTSVRRLHIIYMFSY